MTEIADERVAAELEGDFVVFRIGMRVHRLLKLRKWFPIFRGMRKMLDELKSDPHSGLLAYDTKLGIRNHEFVQYWQSFEKLREYALDPDARHAPAMKWTNRIIEESNAVGIWHETYLVCEDEYETIYHNMPATGLGKAGTLYPATEFRKTATGRLGQTGDEDGVVSQSPIPFDTMLELCGDKHRRIILAVLAAEQRSLTVNDLRRMILTYNHHTPVTDASEEMLTEILVSLHHSHIPKLESAGVIEYDSERQLVEPTEQFDQLQPHLSAILGIDPDLNEPVEL